MPMWSRLMEFHRYPQKKMERKIRKMSVDISVQSQVEEQLQSLINLQELESLAQSLLNDLDFSESELSIRITDDEEIRVLNQQYRSKDMPTDVLSFALFDEPIEFSFDEDVSEVGQESQRPQDLLGDVVISLDTACRQAKEQGITPRDEVIKLLIHGLLHLLGYEHENVPDEDAQLMAAKEEDLFERFGRRG